MSNVLIEEMFTNFEIVRRESGGIIHLRLD